ncbi:MAG TPA: sensor histidine kinase [Nocardioidaceae bacterium]|nr:sensor histidine kinase [Nocardioidaceae bacterium]
MDTRQATFASAGSALVLMAVAIGLEVASGSHAGSWIESLFGAIAVITTAAVALVIGLRRPGNRIGLVLALEALALALAGSTEAYGVYALLAEPGSLPGGRIAVLWSDASWPLLFAGITALGFVFPDGHLPTPRWRPMAVVAVGSFAGATLLSLFSSDPFEAPFTDVPRPLPDLPAVVSSLQMVVLLGLLASLVAAAVAVVTRYRRSSGVERLQILWLAYAAWLLPAALVACLADWASSDELSVVTFGFLIAAVVAIPLAVGIAILRYRLYDIDRVINRTLVYGALTACVGAVYLLLVLAFGALAGGGRSLAVSLVATAVAAAAAQPFRSVLQRRVNRLMYGDRDDPYLGLSRLADRVQASTDTTATLGTIAETIREALRLPFAAIDVPGQHGMERAASDGRSGRGDEVVLPLTFGGVDVGRLVVETRDRGESLDPADRRLLADLSRHAAAAVHAVRLTADLQRSRHRLVVAREEERRRIRRDLHDGLGPTLASAVFQVDAARDLTGDVPGADDLLSDLRTTLQAAVASIRTLVYALRPPTLDELGLLPALQEQAEGLRATDSAPSITVDGPSKLPPLPAAVEVAAYRIALEALTNAVRHSGGQSCSVRLGLNGGLDIEVSDDGIGCRPHRVGVGIMSMRERASEVGANLTIESGPTGGTRVHTVLPIEGT